MNRNRAGRQQNFRKGAAYDASRDPYDNQYGDDEYGASYRDRDDGYGQDGYAENGYGSGYDDRGYNEQKNTYHANGYRYGDDTYADGTYEDDAYGDGTYGNDAYTDASYDDDAQGGYAGQDDGYTDSRAGSRAGFSRARGGAGSTTGSTGRTGKSGKAAGRAGQAGKGSADHRNSASFDNASRNRRTQSRGSRKKKRRNTPVIITILLIVILCFAFGMKLFLDRYSYSRETADLSSYFSITDEEDVPIVWNNAISDVRGRLIGGTYYLDLTSVQKNLNSRFYYGVQNDDDTTGMIIYCLPTEKLTCVVGSQDVISPSGTQTKEYVPAVKEGDTVYLALPFVKEYTNFTYEIFENPNRLQITSTWESVNTATITRNTQIRTSGGIKSPILEQIEKGTTVTVLDQMENWSKVASPDAIIGYVENKRLSEVQETAQTQPTDYQEPEFTRNLHGSATKINMAFHAVFGVGGNDTLQADIANVKDVNVLAPTWFWVDDNSGNITSAARQDYVDIAHGRNMEVWAAVDNFNSTNLPDHNTFLKTLDARTNLISQLMTQVDTFGLDGINVDFEQIEEDNGQNYIEFIRELSIACRNKGITLSVDDYVPYEFNDFYDLREQGVFADYVVIMGYDEHYAGDQTPGPNASIGYVTDGITNAVSKVDKERVINAIPFYSRIWFTEGSQVISEAYGMQDIQNYIAENNMTQTWDAETGMNYTEMTRDDGAYVQIWVEDVQSIKEKLDVMQSAGIGGVAEWKLEFDVPEVWDVIAQYMESGN